MPEKNFLSFKQTARKKSTVVFFRLKIVAWKRRVKRLLRAENLFSQHHRPLKAMLAAVLIIVILVNIFQPNSGQIAQGATFTFVQTSWAGGASTTAIAVHPTNQTSWTYYDSASSISFASTTNLTLATSSYSATDDGTFTTTGDDTGGGFSTGTVSSVLVFGSGSSALLKLATTSQQIVDAWDTDIKGVPATVLYDGDIEYASNGIYVLRGNTSNDVYKYSTSTNTWAQLTDLPAAVGANSTADMDSDGTYLYVFPDTNTKNIYRHLLSTTTGSWDTFSNTGISNNIQFSDLQVNASYIYIMDPTADQVLRHTVANTSSAWEAFATLPRLDASSGTALRINSTDIFVMPGTTATTTYRHTLSDTSSAWVIYPPHPALSGTAGSQMEVTETAIFTIDGATSPARTFLRDISDTVTLWTTSTLSSGITYPSLAKDDTYVYLNEGGTAFRFYRRALADTSSAWTSFSGIPTQARKGNGGTVEVGGGNIYVLKGETSNHLFSHSTATTSGSWGGTVSSTLPVLSANAGAGAALAKDSSYVYALRGNANTAQVYRHDLSVSTGAWDIFTTTGLAGNAGLGSDIAVDSSNVYVLNSSNNIVYRKTSADTSTAWVTFGTGIDTIAAGADLDIVGDYAYVLRGTNNKEFYRHAISTTSGAWETFTNLPSNVSTGGGMDFTDTDVYVFGTASTTVYKHTLSDTSSAWIAFNTMPAAPGDGGGIQVNSTDVYILRGGGVNSVYRHTLSDTSSAWATFSTTNISNVAAGGAMALTDSNIYVLSGNSSNDISFHTLSDTSSSWTQAMDVPTGNVAGGGDIIANGNSELYVLEGNNTNNVFKYIVDSAVYASSGTFTSASIDIGANSFTTISWTSSTPASVGANAVRVQVATSSDNSSYSSYVGSDGTTGTYFTIPGQSASALGSTRYIKYKVYLQTTDTGYTPSLSDITFNYVAYAATGTLISSIYDSADATNVLSSLKWSESLSSGTNVLFQARTASTSALIADAVFMGPDGTSSTYFTDPTAAGETITSTQRDGLNDRFIQYRATLTSNGANTPSLSSATVTYVVNATPEVQSAVATPNSDGTVTITYQVRDADTNTGSTNPGYVSTTFQYCVNATTTGCVAITAFPSGTGINNSVTTSNWTSYTATWTPRTDLGASTYDSNAVIKVIVNDNEAANNTANTTSAAFVLDTAAPSAGSVVVDASTTPAYLTISASDTSTMQMKISLNSDLSGASWQTYATTSTISLATDPDTVYIQFRDAYGNTTTIASATTPETPTSTMIQDISNVIGGVSEYRLFIAWKVVASPSPGFSSYKVYRLTSTSQLGWNLLTTITGRTTNFYTDNAVTASTTYYYRVITTDSSGNVSYNSATSTGNANGTQDGTEGGGATATAAAPTISNVATSSISANSVTITWDTDVLSNSRVGYSTTAGNFTDNTVTVSSMVNNSSGVGQHAVALVGLAANTTYYFQVRSDNVDNVSTTAPTSGNGYTFTTANGTTISGVANTEVSNNRATITWNTTNNATSWVFFSTTSNFAANIATGTEDSVTSHSVILTGLSAAIKYYYYVASKYNSVTTTDRNIINGEIEYYRFTTTNDSSAPSITSISATALTSTASITWNTNEDADSQVTYGTSTNYGTTTTLNSTLTLQHSVSLSSLVTNTLYHYKVLSSDANGNLTPSSDNTFTTLGTSDTTAPTISNVATSSVTLTAATISWTTSELTNFLVDYGTSGSYGSVAGDASDYSTSTHSVTLSSLSGNTTYYFRVRSQDVAGNTATSSQRTFITVADTTGPTISSVQTSVVSDVSANVTWATNEAADSAVWYGTDTTTPSSFTSSTLRTNHSVTLTSLAKNVTYYYKVISADASSNATTDNNSGTFYSFVTLSAPITVVGGGGGGSAIDRSAPDITAVSVTSTTPNSVLISWRSSEEGNSLVRINTEYGNLVGNDEQLSVFNHSVAVKKLTPGTTYRFKAVTYDASGNRGESAEQIFTTLKADGTAATSTPTTTSTAATPEETEPDLSYISDILQKASSNALRKFLDDIAKNPALKNVPEDTFVKALTEMTNKVVDAPEIVGIKPTVEVKGTTAIIKWSTDKKSSSGVNYARESDYKPQTASPYSNAAVNPDEFSSAHRVELVGLDPGTIYHFQVVSKGLVGPEARSGDFIFQTTAELPIISDIRVTRPQEAQSSVVVNWKTNVSTAGAVNYTSKKTGKSLSQGDDTLLINHEITLKGLEGGIDYTLVIRAKDEFGNEVSSLPLTFSTVIDKVPPKISKLSSESTLYPGKDSRVQTIISWETDEPGTSQVFYQEGLSGNNTVTLPIDSALNTRHIVVVTKFKPGTVYKYWVESKDLAGNVGHSEIFSVLTPQEKETIIDIIINNFQNVFGWTKNIGI